MPPIRVMSFNIRVATAAHVDGTDAWKHRVQLNVQTLRRHQPDIIGFQELQEEQWADYERFLPHYARLRGPAYNNEPPAYAYAAIFWNPQRFERIDEGGFWLSPTPDRHGLAWDATSVRSAAWVRLRALAGEPKEILVLNTHLDNDGSEARLRGAQLIVERLAGLERQGDAVIVMGDFNDDPDSPAYRCFIDAGLCDAYVHAGGRDDADDAYTFHRFEGTRVPGAGKGRIDWILYRPQKLRILDYTHVCDNENSRYPSDHFPVIASLDAVGPG